MLSYTTLQNIISIARMVIDITIIALLVYYGLKLVRNNSRAIQIFKGVILIIIVRAVVTFFGLKAASAILDTVVQWGFLAIIIIFQPEIRSLLEKLGKSSVFSRISSLDGNEREKLVDELVDASMTMAEQRVGALITIEQSQSLSDYIKTGTPMNSIVTSDLLQSIFITTTPIHDGAVIIQGDRIACASAYFLPTERSLPRRFGARHRAAVGISEITDAITIVVSEETGNVSIAQNGELTKMTENSLRQFLLKMICHEDVEHGDRGLIKKDINKEEEEKIYRELIQKRAEDASRLEDKDNPAEAPLDDSGVLSIFRKKKTKSKPPVKEEKKPAEEAPEEKGGETHE
ncbi:MAG: diadenylate cyclase CdaA [Erysipelotrichaceae bacterium]|nr:diadenylate cyclase CdaA [Erysipelotrichaceae bacterium]